MASEIGKIIRAQAGTKTMFNDRLKNGKRSIKVSGWLKGDYRIAKKSLQAAGFDATLVEFDVPEYSAAARAAWRGGSAKGKQVRLHVSEK